MLHADFLARLAQEYPKTAKAHDVRSLVIPTLISPTALSLPREWKDEAERLVFLFFNDIRENQRASFAEPPHSRSEELRSQAPELPLPRNASVLMSYDFHVDFSSDPKGRLRLIEINTNASMSLLIDLMNGERGLEPKDDTTDTHSLRCYGRRAKEVLMDDFAEELLTARGLPGYEIANVLQGARVVIVDDEPEKQKLFIEFLLYKELFEKRGATCEIVDRRDLEMRDGRLWAKAPTSEPSLGANDFGPIDLVYNRTTDFYFEEPASAALRDAMLTAATVISPNPYDYRMLADKDRLVEWSGDGALEKIYGMKPEDADRIRAALLRTRETKSIDPELLWKERKGLMFKPRHAYGGKGVFRGSSISRGAFEGVLASDSLAQDFVPAPTTKIDGVEFKYDLRFFAYRDNVHVACARLYQGQMTNATTPGGGVTSIHWV
ncbi:hypothetical protein BH10BDE1_BH10BDE1_35850 [soil metagenome]